MLKHWCTTLKASHNTVEYTGASSPELLYRKYIQLKSVSGVSYVCLHYPANCVFFLIFLCCFLAVIRLGTYAANRMLSLMGVYVFQGQAAVTAQPWRVRTAIYQRAVSVADDGQLVSERRLPGSRGDRTPWWEAVCRSHGRRSGTCLLIRVSLAFVGHLWSHPSLPLVPRAASEPVVASV